MGVTPTFDPGDEPLEDDIDAFVKAAREGKKRTVAACIEKFGNKIINEKSSGGETALTWAAYAGKDDVVKLLLDLGAPVDQKNDKGETALMTAISNCQSNTARLLLDRGASPDEKSNSGWTPLKYAQWHQHMHPELVPMIEAALEDKKAGQQKPVENTMERVRTGLTPIFNSGGPLEDDIDNFVGAAREGKRRTVMAYIDKFGDKIINETNSAETTALASAAFAGKNEVVTLLLDRGALVDGKDKGMTALMKAIWNGKTETAQLLIDRGASLSAKGTNGWSVLEFAQHYNENAWKNPAMLPLIEAAINKNKKPYDYGFYSPKPNP